MAKIKGKEADFSITTGEVTADGPFQEGDSGMTRIEAISSEITLNTDARTVDSSAYGDDFDQFEVMTYNWKLDATFYFDPGGSPDPDAIFQLGILELKKKAFMFWPNGFNATPSATQPEYSGRVLISSVAVNPDRAGLVSVRVSFQGDGQLHRVIA